jgi:Na+-translocating ferredoxin:NAD+ oxidoreductase RnfG subunit
MRLMLNITTLLLGLISISPAFAGGVYQQADDFIREVFVNKPPKADVLWLDADLKKQIADILDHNYQALRVRYWRQDKKSAWVLEEIGKEKPITTGIVINNGKIEQVKILVFRESRGWEVRHDFFTGQFKQAALNEDHMLDKTIDNISGATLSVRAVRKLARIALLLDQTIQKQVVAQ